MIVTGLEPVTKKTCGVYLDGQFAFALYKGELSRYGIQEGEELPQETIDKIRSEILPKRARAKAMAILNRMDRTEEQLRSRLEQELYPPEAVDGAIQYVKSFGYIGDEGYARRFVESRRESKSRLEIRMALLQRGVPKEIVQDALEEAYGEQGEEDAIQKLLKKRGYAAETAAAEETRKTYAYLLRKGFRHEEVCRAMHLF